MSPRNSETYAELEIGLSAGADGGCRVELRYSDPESETEIPPVSGAATLDVEQLLAASADTRAYGEALGAGLFAAPGVREHYRQVKTAAEAAGRHLRLRLRVDRSMSRLQGLRWELLRDPDTGDALATSETVLFSRFMASRDWRPVTLRPKSELKALVAVSSPSDLGEGKKFPLAAVDLAGEIDRARAALAGIRVEVAGDRRPLTLDHLVECLRAGVDVLYLVCHGAMPRRRREPVLYLQDDDGATAVTPGAELAARLRELRAAPRLVFLASCDSALASDAGDGSVGELDARASLAPRLAEAGVAAIVAMQGKISIATIERMAPAFFAELLEDGRIDRALAVARGRVRDRPDAWMPALTTRLKGGRIWQQGFAGDGDELERWRALVGNLLDGKCVPVLGPDVGRHLYGGTGERARELAERYDYPLEAHGRGDLAKVSQFVRVKESVNEARRQVVGQLKQHIAERFPDSGGSYKAAAARCLEDAEDPYRILAELPAAVYVSAGFDLVLPHVLAAADRKPKLLFPTWRATAGSHAHRQPSRAAEGESAGGYRPSERHPVVFNAFGVDRKGARDSLVLTEDDLLDYLIVAKRLLPPVVAGEIVQSSLIFLGFPLRHLSFRALFRLLLSLDGSESLRDNAHVGVQVDPAEHSLDDVERAREYLRQYFHAAAPTIEIYWGSVTDFLTDLRERRRVIEATHDSPAATADDEDDWIF